MPADTPPTHLFIYGTLHPDRAPAEIAPAVARLRLLAPATIPGRLLDLGPYPGVLPGVLPDTHTTVSGTLFELPDDPELLAALDHYEGYDPTNLPASLFRREITIATLSDGITLPCWVYLFNQPIQP